MHTFDSLCRYPKRKNVSLSNPLTRIRRTRLSQGVGPRNPLAKNRILRSVNRIAASAGGGGASAVQVPTRPSQILLRPQRQLDHPLQQLFGRQPDEIPHDELLGVEAHEVAQLERLAARGEHEIAVAVVDHDDVAS